MSVVVGAAIRRDGLILAARRSAPPELAGGWEFPGGKVEPGETDAAALVRECREELGVDVVAGALLAESAVRPGVVLRVYLASLIAGEPRPLQDHDELRWLGIGELAEVAWLPADLRAVAALEGLLR